MVELPVVLNAVFETSPLTKTRVPPARDGRNAVPILAKLADVPEVMFVMTTGDGGAGGEGGVGGEVAVTTKSQIEPFTLLNVQV